MKKIFTLFLTLLVVFSCSLALAQETITDEQYARDRAYVKVHYKELAQEKVKMFTSVINDDFETFKTYFALPKRCYIFKRKITNEQELREAFDDLKMVFASQDIKDLAIVSDKTSSYNNDNYIAEYDLGKQFFDMYLLRSDTASLYLKCVPFFYLDNGKIKISSMSDLDFLKISTLKSFEEKTTKVIDTIKHGNYAAYQDLVGDKAASQVLPRQFKEYKQILNSDYFKQLSPEIHSKFYGKNDSVVYVTFKKSDEKIMEGNHFNLTFDDTGNVTKAVYKLQNGDYRAQLLQILQNSLEAAYITHDEKQYFKDFATKHPNAMYSSNKKGFIGVKFQREYTDTIDYDQVYLVKYIDLGLDVYNLKSHLYDVLFADGSTEEIIVFTTDNVIKPKLVYICRFRKESDFVKAHEDAWAKIMANPEKYNYQKEYIKRNNIILTNYVRKPVKRK